MKATTKPALEHRRMNALLLLDDGMPAADVARVQAHQKVEFPGCAINDLFGNRTAIKGRVDHPLARKPADVIKSPGRIQKSRKAGTKIAQIGTLRPASAKSRATLRPSNPPPTTRVSVTGERGEGEEEEEGKERDRLCSIAVFCHV